MGREGEINLLDSLVRTLKQILVYHLASAVIRIVQPFLDVKKEKTFGFRSRKEARTALLPRPRKKIKDLICAVGRHRIP